MREPLYVTVDRCDRSEQGIARHEQPAQCARQSRNLATGAGDLLRECRTKPARQPDSEDKRQTADLVLESDALPNEFLAGDDQRANRMGGERLHMDRLVEAGAGKMC